MRYLCLTCHRRHVKMMLASKIDIFIKYLRCQQADSKSVVTYVYTYTYSTTHELSA
jgi:hypothetical protein